MENKIDINKISAWGPGATRAQLANKASAQLMNQQETYLKDSTSVCRGGWGTHSSAQLAREPFSFLYAIYAKKNYNSIVNKQIYGLNNSKIIEGKNLPVFYKHFPPAIREWSNSIFTFYPNLTVLMGFAMDKMVIKIIKSYFNSKNKLQKNDRQLGVKDKVYLSKLTVKHTSSKVIITVYIYATLYKQLDWLYKNLNTIPIPSGIGRSNFSLADLLAKYYNKKVCIRVVRLRYLSLNSNILAEYLANGLAQRKGNPLNTLRSALKRAKIPRVLNTDLIKEGWTPKDISDVSLENYKNKEAAPLVNEQLLKEVLVSTRYKSLAGIKMEIAGRLNRRAIAARSVVKTGQVGSLKNFESSYKGLSSVVLRGHVRPNLEKASFNYKTRNGAFNVKVWTSNY